VHLIQALFLSKQRGAPQAALNKFGINFTNKKGLALFLNLIRCEAHSDLSKEIIKEYLNKR